MRLGAGGSGFFEPACLVLLKVPVVTVGIGFFVFPILIQGPCCVVRSPEPVLEVVFFDFSITHAETLLCSSD